MLCCNKVLIASADDCWGPLSASDKQRGNERVSGLFVHYKPSDWKWLVVIIIIIITIIINCNWVVTRWQWLFYMYTNIKKK